MKIRFKTICFLLFVFGTSGLIKPVFAVSDNLIINEIMYNLPGSDEDREWIEVQNVGINSIIINSDWRLNDETNHLLYVFQGSNTIESNSYFIIAQDPPTFLINYPNFSGTILKSSFSLSNEQGNIKISNNKGQSWISEINYSNNLGANGDGNSLEWDYEINSLCRSYIIGGTPGKTNSTILDLPQYSKDVYINEIYANPSNGTDNEFIEFYNNSEREVNISGWKLDDINGGGSQPYVFSNNSIIKPRNYLVYYHIQTNVSLNNKGDTVRLLYPDEREASVVFYPKVNTNLSYARNNEGIWQWSTACTPSEENKFSPVETLGFLDKFISQNNNISSIELTNIQTKKLDSSKNITTISTVSDENKINLTEKNISSFEKSETQEILGKVLGNTVNESKTQTRGLTKSLISLIIITNVLSIIYIFWLWKKPTFLNPKTLVNNSPKDLPKQ